METLISKVSDPEVFKLILESVAVVLYLTGRITKAQLLTEQIKAKSPMASSDAKSMAVDKASLPLTFIFDALDQIPVINTKIPGLNASLPQTAKTIVQFPFGVLNDLIFNTPIFGNKAK